MSLVNTSWVEKNIDKLKIIDCSWHMPNVERDGHKEYLESHTSWNSDIIKVVGGGTAGITAVSITYPTDLIRRRLQLQNFDKSVPKYSGILDCINKIVKSEGPRGLYRGLTATYIKLFPTIGIQFLAMERLNQCLK